MIDAGVAVGPKTLTTLITDTEGHFGNVDIRIVVTQLPGDLVTLPNANATTSGNGGLNSLIGLTTAPRTYQMAFSASELANVPIGAQVTAISWRLQPSTANGTDWPAGESSRWRAASTSTKATRCSR